jgi:CBS domain-containing protein
MHRRIGMKMRDLMRTQPFTARESDLLGAAQRMMARIGSHHLPVVDGDRVTGMLSERDVLAYRAKADADEEWWRASVADAMTAPVHTAAPDDSLTEVAARLAAERIGAMPIVERGKLVGLVTTTDVLAAEVRVAMEAAPPTLATAADVMTAAPAAVSPEATLLEAVRILVDRGIRHLPVVDEGGGVLGMLSDRDVRDLVGDPQDFIASWKHDPMAVARVSDAMRKVAVTVAEDRPLIELASIFADEKIGALPVVARDGKLIGIVSYVDVLRALAR